MSNANEYPETYTASKITEPEEKEKRQEKKKHLEVTEQLQSPRSAGVDTGEGEPMDLEPLWVYKVGRQNACMY